MGTWVIINLKCLFKRETTWEKIEHVRDIKIAEVKEEEVPEVETTPEPSSVAPDITSKQNSNIAILFHTIKVLKEYGDQLRSLEAEGFVIEDAQTLVEANALGFSFNELLHNEKMVETLSSIVNSLK